MEKVFDIREAPSYISRFQQDSLKALRFVPDPLIGSQEWWQAIDDGMIERVVMQGWITSVTWGAMGDTPEFEITDESGRSRRCHRYGDHTRYVKGLAARVTWLRLKVFPINLQHVPPEERADLMAREIDLLCESISIEESERRSEKSAPGPSGVLERNSLEALEVTDRAD
ncbi:MAG: hypothetical protein AB7S38_12230 [Vulcanimicrobiota bacterium]